MPSDLQPSFGFDPPAPLRADLFHLEPLAAVHNERDHDAWMSSIGHIKATPGFADRSWPTPMTLAENLADLQMHWREYEQRIAFTYSILNGDDVVGCVYIYPPNDGGTVPRVRSWVRASWAERDDAVRSRIRAWLLDDWTFDDLGSY